MKQQTQPLLEFRDLRKSYEATEAVAGVSLTIPRGEFVALVGASGSGKSTLLKTVNRLVEPTSGQVRFEDDNVESLPLAALRHKIGYVFQSVGLFPHMTVGENIAIGPRLVGERLSAERIGELLADLSRRGLLENSIIAIASDHGEGFGERGYLGHCRIPLFEGMVATPLFLRIPGVATRGRIDGPVQNLDIFPTVLDYLGIDAGDLVLEGTSLRAAIEGDAP